MKTKMLEIRDECTCIPVIAIKTKGENIHEQICYSHCGWGEDSLILIKYNGFTEANHDPFEWDTTTRTTREAHRYIQEHFDDIPNFSVVDVRFILGETEQPAQSDIFRL